jgi:membrane protein involved in colicin uptake
MDGVIEEFDGDDMMGAVKKPLAKLAKKVAPAAAKAAAAKAAAAQVAAAKKSAPKTALAVKAKSAAGTAKVAKVAAKKVQASKAPAKMKKEALSIASAAAQIAARAAKLSQMAGVEPELMGDAGDYYNIGSMQMGAIEQFSGYGAIEQFSGYGAIEQFSGVEPELMGEDDFGDADFGDADFGEDDGMMGGLVDTLKSPAGMAALAIGGWFLWKKMKR